MNINIAYHIFRNIRNEHILDSEKLEAIRTIVSTDKDYEAASTRNYKRIDMFRAMKFLMSKLDKGEKQDEAEKEINHEGI